MTMISKSFLFAGKAIFTAVNPKGEHYTFRVSKGNKKNETDPDVFFISILTGPDNTSAYAYMGILNLDGSIRLTKGSRYTFDTRALQVAQWAAHSVINGVELADGYRIDNAGKCGRCGRLLTNAVDNPFFHLGFGNECAEIMGMI